MSSLFVDRSAVSAQHLSVLLHGQGLRGPAAGVPDDQRLHLHCSIQPQYPGGSFQLNFTSINSANTYYSLPAVNHSAHFLFPSTEPAHQGSYSCVYHLFVFSHNFSSESRLLSVSVTGELLHFIRLYKVYIYNNAGYLRVRCFTMNRSMKQSHPLHYI